MQPQETKQAELKRNLNDYKKLIETLAKVEYSRLTSSHLIDFSELLNIGAYAVHSILKTNEERNFNNTYMSTAIKWAIRNELRRRYKWYSAKADKKNLDKPDKEEIRTAVYETILSIDELAEAENPTQIKDAAFNPEENVEFNELQQGIKKAIKVLPLRQRQIIEARFYGGKKLKELTDEFEVSSSRLSRIIQTGLDRIKEELIKQELI